MQGPKFSEVGKMPFESGDYWCVDLMTNEQWYCHLFHKDNEGLKVFETKTRETHNAADYDRPNIRWFRLNPIPKDELDRAVGQGVAYEQVGAARESEGSRSAAPASNLIGGTATATPKK